MKLLENMRVAGLLAVGGLLLNLAPPVSAEGPVVSAPGADHERVELFEAMGAGHIEVNLIPKNAKVANVIIRNNTDRPLAIRLPEAFAGVPVLAQFGGGGLGGGGGGLGGGGGGNQGVGGGFGGGGGGFGGGGAAALAAGVS